MHLSKNFKLEEFLYTDYPICLIPSIEHLENLEQLVEDLMQPIRDKHGPVKILSGYRSEPLQYLIYKKRGLKLNLKSHHLTGRACDFIPLKKDLLLIYIWIIENLNYGTVILYQKEGFIHINTGLQKKQLLFEDGKYIVFNGKSE